MTESNGNTLLEAAIENAGVSIMMCDRDLRITYANRSTMNLLQTYEQELAQVYPGFKPDRLIGTCIDDFHKDASYQRGILNDPRNLPHTADIQVGALTFALNISAMYDGAGDYVGNCLEWQEVTEARRQADEAARLRGAMEGSATASMMVDRDLLITYANPATTRLVQSNLSVFQEAFPQVDFTNLLGVCVDVFHKDPAYQRRILGDPANLPHKATIQVGSLTFELNISAIHDINNQYVGANLEWADVTASALKIAEYEGQVEAISKAQAVIEFNLDGTIITANDNFLTTLGYTLEEVQGKHHRMFVEEAERNSQEYRQFWDRLNEGKYQASEYRRIGKQGNEIWIQASYNPIFDQEGNPFKVIKYATDITAAKKQNAEYEGQVKAISKAQAVIEFNLDGTIITANENFLVTLGYSLDEIQGKHHQIFVDDDLRDSMEYRQFWDALNRGEYQAGEFKRITKQGAEIWIQASYNPILDDRGKPFKVIKFATDITAQRIAKSKAESMLSMIEGAASNFMTCDRDFKVTYINPALTQMFQRRESEIRKAIPNFDARNLIGVCIDDFHVNPAHQRRLLEDTRNLPASVEIKIGDLEFKVTANALVDSAGNFIGNAAEWTDLNERADYRREVDGLIAAGLSGDLKKRGEVSRLSEAYQPMMEGINEILDAVVAPMNEAGTVLQYVGQQDLTARVMGDYQGDHAAIKNNLNGALQALEQALSRAKEASIQVNQASEQIATGSQTLAEGASEQAASLQEVSASLEQLTAMTNQNADNASQADVLAKESRGMATKGNEAMQDMEAAINKIKVSSDQTAKIIKTIDEIAFQTNLLALNAAVEAARAGEAGKGFAVVAEEVRNLAARSAEAAKNTAEMIEESVKNAEGGVQISSNVAAILNDIMESAAKVSDFISDIAAASKEQATGLNQINTAVNEMDKVTQSNAAGSEESAAAAEQLSAQSESLGSIIAAFRISPYAGGQNGSMQGGLPAPGWQQVPPPPQQPVWQPSTPPQQSMQQPTWQPPGQVAPSGDNSNTSTPSQPWSQQGADWQQTPPPDRRVRRPEEVIPLDDGDLQDF